jgi:hypothetical protein
VRFNISSHISAVHATREGTGTTGRCAPECQRKWTYADDPKVFNPGMVYAVTFRMGAAHMQYAMFSCTRPPFHHLGPVPQSARVAGLQADHYP